MNILASTSLTIEIFHESHLHHRKPQYFLLQMLYVDIVLYLYVAFLVGNVIFFRVKKSYLH